MFEHQKLIADLAAAMKNHGFSPEVTNLAKEVDLLSLGNEEIGLELLTNYGGKVFAQYYIRDMMTGFEPELADAFEDDNRVEIMVSYILESDHQGWQGPDPILEEDKTVTLKITVEQLKKIKAAMHTLRGEVDDAMSFMDLFDAEGLGCEEDEEGVPTRYADKDAAMKVSEEACELIDELLLNAEQ